MKALKVVLVLMMVSFTMMSYAQFRDSKSDDRSVIQLKMLLDKPIYVNAILTQVDRGSIFNREAGSPIIVKIWVCHKPLLISGSYAEWEAFFNTNHILPFFKKSPDGQLGDE